MRLKAFIKLTLRSVLRELPIMIFTFAIFPIVLSSLYGYFQKDMFNPKNEIDKVAIYIEDRDNSKLSNEFIKFLGSNELNEFIDIKKSKEKAIEEVIIPKGYEKGIIGDKEIIIKISERKKDKEVVSKILKELIDNYTREVKNNFTIENSINKMDISKEKKELLLKETSEDITRIYKKDTIKNLIVKSTRNLTSYEYYSVSILSFMFIVTIISLCNRYYEDKRKGIFQRTLSTSISKVQYFNYSLVSWYIFAVLFNSIYVLSYRLLGLSFKGNIGLLLLIVLTKSLLEVAISSVVIAFFKEQKMAAIFLNIVIVITVSLGGVFYPLDKVINSFNKIVRVISDFAPNVLIMKTYKTFLIYNSFEAIKYNLITFILISMALYSISLLKINMKWGD
ncbi:ABC transporter permease [Clostridium sp. L74]|uniref:ABC transporter permease n=1 Tax=Clostridium sp. L74 TaxID=1560217 RepID=UPI0006ABECA8|nr:ABC transporter permease [Clostridium sp. L74]EJP6471102.1 ABC transporter permease [Clostridium botulinum]KOR23900.1 ABC transporter permease [Clostridium sp. L74]